MLARPARALRLRPFGTQVDAKQDESGSVVLTLGHMGSTNNPSVPLCTALQASKSGMNKNVSGTAMMA
eukprot:1333284-Amphidinium_carterae.2